MDIDIDSNAREGLALFDGDTVIISGTSADEAAAKLLHARSDGPVLWLRRGDQAYVVHDPAMLQRARMIYAPVEDYWRQAGGFEGKEWAIKGPMEGLQAWQASVQSQRVELLADPGAPAYRERLASLDSQQRDITQRLATLRQKLAALQPQIANMQKQRQATQAEVNRRISALIDDAVASGAARPVG